MVVPSVAMARSFINPKDRAAEVQRRRQQAEAELQRRREERIRQIQEKSDNATKRKQMGLQEKRIKHKTEAEHLREINKRRIEKENQEKQRIQVCPVKNPTVDYIFSNSSKRRDLRHRDKGRQNQEQQLLLEVVSHTISTPQKVRLIGLLL